MSLHTQS
ncbi:uncharacterized protein ACO6RY_04882 [Pungitius sinensis]